MSRWKTTNFLEICETICFSTYIQAAFYPGCVVRCYHFRWHFVCEHSSYGVWGLKFRLNLFRRFHMWPFAAHSCVWVASVISRGVLFALFKMIKNWKISRCFLQVINLAKRRIFELHKGKEIIGNYALFFVFLSKIVSTFIFLIFRCTAIWWVFTADSSGDIKWHSEHLRRSIFFAWKFRWCLLKFLWRVNVERQISHTYYIKTKNTQWKYHLQINSLINLLI